MHEMLHGVGVIPWAGTQWSKYDLRSSKNGDGYGSGYWLGDRVTEVLSFWDNKDFEQLNGDYQHMWPYGINGAHEDNGSDVLYIGNGLVCQALGEDGLEHTDKHFAEPYYAIDVEDNVKYYLKSENEDRGFYTSYLVENEDGSLTWKEIALSDLASQDEAAWYITFTPENQFYQLRNAKTGNYLYLNRILTPAATGCCTMPPATREPSRQPPMAGWPRRPSTSATALPRSVGSSSRPNRLPRWTMWASVRSASR